MLYQGERVGVRKRENTLLENSLNSPYARDVGGEPLRLNAYKVR